VKANDLKPGMALDIDSQIWLVVKTEHVKPGKGPAFIQAKLKNLHSGSNIEKRLRTSEDVSRIELDRREFEYLYSDNTGAVFMDTGNYEQTVVNESVLGDALLYIKPNTPTTALVHNGNVVSVDLPAAVDLEVTDTPPGIKNATATNQLKEAELETGLKTRVPPFINVGETVRVSTESGEYLSRVSSG
jgi:elongation factor P